jgi:hypothetical protein
VAVGAVAVAVAAVAAVVIAGSRLGAVIVGRM